MDWRTAYFNQARSHFEMFEKLQQLEGVSLCHQLHYLQMATEKLAKGFLTPTGGPEYGRTHDAFALFMNVAKGVPSLKVACKFTRDDQFREYIKSLTHLAGHIQNLSPEGADHPNPEYPWRDDQGRVTSPLQYPFAHLNLQGPKMLKLLRFINDCFRVST